MEDYGKKNKKLLIEYIKEGSSKAFDELVVSNTGLVSRVLKKVNVPVEKYEDLYDLGIIYLIEAIRKFDLKYIDTCSFSTFACLYMERKFHVYFTNDNKHHIECSVSLDGYDDLNVGDMYDAASYKNYLLVEDSFDEVENNLDNEKNRKILEYAMANLSEIDQKVICMNFGMNTKYPLKQVEIAKIMGVTRATISKKIINARENLLKYLQYDEKSNLLKLKEPLTAKTIVRMSFDNKNIDKKLYEVVSNFKQLKRDVFLDYFGLYGNEKLGINEICEKYDLEDVQIKRMIRYCLDKIENKFNNLKKDCKKR